MSEFKGNIEIFRGRDHKPVGNVSIVIDVYRAFTVQHHLFLNGVEKVIMANETETILALKAETGFTSIGEINGIKIEGFDFGNSPSDLATAELGKELTGTVIHKTSSGVKAAINASGADTVYVTGLSNAANTARAVRELHSDAKQINIIASHPSDDDDMICAEYIERLIRSQVVDFDDYVRRIRSTSSAQKFLQSRGVDFPEQDHYLCTEKVECDFVMQVDFNGRHPTTFKKKI